MKPPEKPPTYEFLCGKKRLGKPANFLAALEAKRSKWGGKKVEDSQTQKVFLHSFQVWGGQPRPVREQEQSYNARPENRPRETTPPAELKKVPRVIRSFPWHRWGIGYNIIRTNSSLLLLSSCSERRQLPSDVPLSRERKWM